MEIEKFIKTRPYLYHLTDARNVDSILEDKKLISTKSIIGLSDLTSDEGTTFLRSKRGGHKLVKAENREFFVRDQQPISMKVLNRSTTDGLSGADFIELLNNRVFFWPTIKDLKTHYGRYADEKPTIFRFDTEELLEINGEPMFCKWNSGAPRCHHSYGGNAAPRGLSTFQSATDYPYSHTTIREVTFIDEVFLPEKYWIGNEPEGKWVEKEL